MIPLPIAVAIWMGFQLLALGLAAARVPFWVDYPATGEHYAGQLLVIFQMGMLLSVWPALLPTSLHALTLAASVWLMAILSIALSGDPLVPMLKAQALVCGWIIALRLVHLAARSPSIRQWLAAITTGMTWLPVLYIYLGEEFAIHRPWFEGGISRLGRGPMVQGIDLLNGQSATSPLNLLECAVGLAVAGWIIGLLRSHKAG